MLRRFDSNQSPARRAALLFLLALVALLPGTAFAQGSFDFTPAVTYQFGAEFDLYDFEFDRVTFDIEDSDGLALFFGIPVNRVLQIELLAIQQETEISIDEGLFADDFVLGDIAVSYYHVGALWQFPIGQIEPYFAISGGITDMEFDFAGVSDDSFASLSLGGGVKARLTEHLGLRFDGRFFFTDLSDDLYDDDDDCYRRNRCDDDAFVQGVVSAGLLFSF